MRKTVKKTSGIGDIMGSTDDRSESGFAGGDVSNVSYLDEIPPGIVNLQNKTRERDDKINQLLETMTSVDADNDGSNLANFKPPPNPEMSMKKSDAAAAAANYGPNVGIGMPGDTPLDYQSNDYQLPPPPQSVLHRQRNGSSGTYTSVDFDRQAAEYSNYNHVYDPARVVHKPYYMNPAAAGAKTMGNSSAMDANGQLMQKINYMIHMLEQQEVEKTANITEEFILYTFLGVFIIYIVDSFSRSGRYIR